MHAVDHGEPLNRATSDGIKGAPPRSSLATSIPFVPSCGRWCCPQPGSRRYGFGAPEGRRVICRKRLRVSGGTGVGRCPGI